MLAYRWKRRAQEWADQERIDFFEINKEHILEIVGWAGNACFNNCEIVHSNILTSQRFEGVKLRSRQDSS